MNTFKYNFTKPDRLDNAILKLDKTLYRNLVKKLILSKNVFVNHKLVTKPSKKVYFEDLISVYFQKNLQLKQTKITPTKMNLDVVYEDDDFLAINKDYGIVVHPSCGHKEDSLLNGVVYYLIQKLNTDKFFVCPVNRIDKETSGIVIFSKNYSAHVALSKLFKSRQVKKSYLALVSNLYTGPSLITSYITKDPILRRYKSVKPDKNKSQYAETKVILKDYFDDLNFSLLELIPVTGRTHQLRVHLSEIGYPIVGDVLYGGVTYKRMMLHSWKITFQIFNKFIKLNASYKNFKFSKIQHSLH